MHNLGFDLETGGFDPKENTIMEAYFGIWDENWNLLDELLLYMTDDEGNVNATEKALEVTGIDLEEHMARPDLVTYSEGREKLTAMLEKHKIQGKQKHYRYVGQNVIAFDIPFMDGSGFFTKEQAKKLGINHNAVDTTVLVTWLKDMGMLPSTVGSIGSLIEYFGLSKGTAHTAKDDTHMQKDIYIRLCNMIKQCATNNLQGGDNDLLKIVEI